MPVHEGTDLDTPAPWSVLQCVGQYILQYRVHFVLVKPDIQVREAALTGDIDVLMEAYVRNASQVVSR